MYMLMFIDKIIKKFASEDIRIIGEPTPTLLNHALE